MNMNMKKTLVAISATAAFAAVGLGSQSAQAYVYAGSTLDINDLKVTVVGADGAILAPAGYTFDATATSSLNGANAVNNGTISCSGTVGGGAPDTNCTNTIVMGVVTAPVLNKDVTNAPLSEITRAPTDYELSSNIVKTYANSNSEITTAALVNIDTSQDPPVAVADTSITQVVEANIAGLSGKGDALTEVGSTTTFGLLILMGSGGGTITIDFEAALEQALAIVNGAPITTFANANVSSSASATLSLVNGAQVASWTSDGTSGNCGTNCLDVEAYDLGTNPSITSLLFLGIELFDPSFFPAGGGILKQVGNFRVVLTIPAGNCTGGICLYDLNIQTGLTANVENNARAVPAPGTIALLGLGLLGLGASNRRRRSKA